MSGVLNLIVPSGIGDISWIYSKLIDLNMPINFYIADVGPSRAIPYLQLLKNIGHTQTLRMPINKILREGNRNKYTKDRLVKESSKDKIIFQINTWLEDGNRIEDYMPELETNHHYTINIPDMDIAQSNVLIHPFKRYVVFYCSSLRTSRAWNGWQPNQWLELAKYLTKEYDIDGIVIVGAEYDIDMANELMSLNTSTIPMKNLVGKLRIGGTLAIIKNSLYLIGFPSGIPILSSVIEKPVMMFYPEHLSKMHNTWVDPEYLKNGMYKGLLFCTPEQAIDWIKENCSQFFE